MKSQSIMLFLAAIVAVAAILVIPMNDFNAGQAYKAINVEAPAEPVPEEAVSTSTEPTIVKTSYIFAGKRMAEIDGSKLKYFHDDNLGSHSLITRGTGNIESEFGNYPFGETMAESTSHYEYTGKEQDADTGLYYYGARYYSPGSGRFITSDPILRTSSNYAYANNNPMILVDPTGRDAGEPVDKFHVQNIYGVPIPKETYQQWSKYNDILTDPKWYNEPFVALKLNGYSGTRTERIEAELKDAFPVMYYNPDEPDYLVSLPENVKKLAITAACSWVFLAFAGGIASPLAESQANSLKLIMEGTTQSMKNKMVGHKKATPSEVLPKDQVVEPVQVTQYMRVTPQDLRTSQGSTFPIIEPSSIGVLPISSGSTGNLDLSAPGMNTFLAAASDRRSSAGSGGGAGSSK